MAYCYLCGRAVPAGAPRSRRKVKTGESSRRGKSGEASTTSTLGMRVLCPWCTRRVDAEKRREELLQYLEFGAAVGFLLAAALWRAFAR